MTRAAAWALLLLFWVGEQVLQPPGHVRWLLHVLVAAAVGLLLLPSVARERRLPLGPPALASLLALVSLAVALLAGGERWPQSERGWAAVTGLAHALLFLLAFRLVPRAEEGDDAARLPRTVLLAGLLLLLALQPAAHLLQDPPPPRLAGTFGNPNAAGAFAAAAGLAVAALLRWRPPGLLVLFGAGVVLFQTRSRGAMAAGALVLLLLVLRRSPVRALLLAAGLAALLLLVPNPLVERIEALRTGHTFSRPFLWHAALQNAAEHPLGIGPGMNEYVFPPLAWHPDFPWLLHQRHAVGIVHNVLLTLLLEWGWLAGAAAVGLLAWAAARFLPRRRPSDPLGQGAALAALVLLLEAQVDGLDQKEDLFSLALVLGAVALARLPGPVRGVRVPGRLVAAALLAACVALAAAAGWRGRVLVHTGRAADALEAAARGELADDAARAALSLAAVATPGEAAPARMWFRFEAERLKAALLAGATPEQLVEPAGEAWRALVLARDADPLQPELLASEAELLRLMWRRGGGGDVLRDRYFRAMEELLEIDPLDVEARLQYGLELQREGLTAWRRHHMGRLLALEPDEAFAWTLEATWAEEEGDLERALAAWVRAEEAVHNARVKAGVDSPRSRIFYERLLRRVDLEHVRARVAQLRRQLYL